MSKALPLSPAHRRRAFFFIILVITLSLVVFWPSRRQTAAPNPAAKPVIAATIFPLYDIVREVAGEELDVVLVCPPGASPHTYEPPPSVLSQISTAQTVFAIGHGIDGWITTLTDAVGVPVTVVDRSIALRASADADEHEDGDEREHGHNTDGTDPHYWLNLTNGHKIAINIAAELSRRFPGRSAAFAQNLRRYQNQLDQAEAGIRTLLSDLSTRNLVTLHDAWYYFAEGYGLNITGSFEPSAGREPTPKYLSELMTALHDAHTKVVYSEPQLSVASLSSFAADNDLRIAVLDPIGGLPGRDSYIKLITYNAQIIADNQK